MSSLGVFLLVSTAVTVLGWWLGRHARARAPFWRLWLQVVVCLALAWVAIAPLFVLALSAVAIVGRLLVMPVLVALGLMSTATMGHDNFALAAVLGGAPLAICLLLLFRGRVRRAWRWAKVWWRNSRRRTRTTR